LDWLSQVQAKTYRGRRPADHPSRQEQPLDLIDLHVAMRLLSHLNRKTGQLDPEHATIAAALGVWVSTVWRSMDRLAEHKFLKATERFRKAGLQTSNQYDLNLELVGLPSTKIPPMIRQRNRKTPATNSTWRREKSNRVSLELREIDSRLFGIDSLMISAGPLGTVQFVALAAHAVDLRSHADQK
jgi:hypothetical protein